MAYWPLSYWPLAKCRFLKAGDGVEYVGLAEEIV